MHLGNTYWTPRNSTALPAVPPVAPEEVARSGLHIHSAAVITMEDPKLQQVRTELAIWKETEKKRSNLQSGKTTARYILQAYCGRSASLFLNYLDIRTVPNAICHLTALQSLDLSHNQIISIPNSIGDLTRLQKLDLSHNQITSLPHTIGKLGQLRSLDLSHNQITSIPNSIGKLGQLKLLCLSDNHLSFLPPKVDGLRELVVLNLENNSDLEMVPIQLANLHKIIRLTAYNTRIPQELFTAIRTAHEEFRNGRTLRTSPPLLQLWNKYLINNFNLSTFIYALPIGEQLALSKLLEIWDARGDCHTAFAKIQNALRLRYRLSPPPVPHAS